MPKQSEKPRREQPTAEMTRGSAALDGPRRCARLWKSSRLLKTWIREARSWFHILQEKIIGKLLAQSRLFCQLINSRGHAAMLRPAGKVLKKHRALTLVCSAWLFPHYNFTELRNLIPVKNAFGDGIFVGFDKHGKSAGRDRSKLALAQRFLIELFSRFQMIAAGGGHDAGAFI